MNRGKVDKAIKSIKDTLSVAQMKTDYFSDLYYGFRLISICKELGYIDTDKDGTLRLLAKEWNEDAIFDMLNDWNEETKKRTERTSKKIGELSDQIEKMKDNAIEGLDLRDLVDEIRSRGYEVKIYEIRKEEVEI